MKTLKKQIRFIALTLALLVFFQSCKVYHSNSVTLEQASQEFKRVKIQTNWDETLKFRGIKMENNQFYGVKKVKKELVNMPLDKNNIKSVKLENETMSTVLTIALPVTILLGTLAIIGSALSNWDLSGMDNLAF